MVPVWLGPKVFLTKSRHQKFCHGAPELFLRFLSKMKALHLCTAHLWDRNSSKSQRIRLSDRYLGRYWSFT
jgi:hypothetical protein